MRKIKILIVMHLGLIISQAGVKGPEYRNLQSMGMGKAIIATHETRQIMYANPAGLRHLSRPFSIGIPLMMSTGDFAMKAFNFLMKNRKTFEKGIDSLSPEESEAFYGSLREFDRKDFVFNGQGEFGIAIRFLSLGAYLRQEFRANMDMGIFNPMMQGKSYSDIVTQGAFAFGKRDKWSLGIAPKILVKMMLEKTVAPAEQVFESQSGSTVKKKKADPFSHFDVNDNIVAAAIDLGAQYSFLPRHFLGASIRDIGKGKGSLRLSPGLHLGYAWEADTTISNPLFQNTLVAFDIQDIGYKMPFTSRLHLGIQRILYFGVLFDFEFRAGLSEGYGTYGVSVVFLKFAHLDFVSFTEEIGDYPGQIMDRQYLLQLQLGF